MRRCGRSVPPLWLFTDAARMLDVVGVVARLPRGLCGVVFRHDGAPDRAALAAAVARVCRQRRLWLAVADARLAWRLRAGVHLRGGRGPRARTFATASAHDGAELQRARRAGAVLTFLSPAFATASHPGARALGPWRWGRWAGRGRVAALGGVDGRTVLRLPRGRCAGAGAITALVA
jgi:thiamine-phosphate pyrophosphorylase